MSATVYSEVRRRSRSQGVDRCVMFTLGDAAHIDGVCWIQQGPEEDENSIAFGARCSEREVRRAIRDLVELGEIEVRKVQRGRVRINVYRVVVGRIGERDVDYSRLPFELDEPFSQPDVLAGRQRQRAASPHEHSARDATTATTGRIVRSSAGATTGQMPSRRPDICDRDDRTPTRARLADPPLEPSEDPSLTSAPSNEEALVPPAAGESVDVDDLFTALVEELGIRPSTRSEFGLWKKALHEIAEAGATIDELRARCARYRRLWPTAALTPTGLARQWTVLSAVGQTAAASTKRAWIENTSWRLPAEDAHAIVDDWPSLDPAERTILHERVDEVRAEHDELDQRRDTTGVSELEPRAQLRGVAS